jgi:hypothetical protein
MYQLPNELLLKIYEFDSTYYEKYKDVINELNGLCDEYSEIWWKYTKLYRRLIWSGNIRKSIVLIDWFKRYGINYDAAYYILNKTNPSKKIYDVSVKRGIRPIYL